MYTQINNEKIRLNFHEGIKVYVEGPENYYLVEINEYKKNSDSPVFVDSYHITTKEGLGYSRFYSLPIEFFFDFEINVYKFTDDVGLTKIFSHRYNDRGKLLKFVLDTKSHDEAMLWTKKISEFQKRRGCDIVLETKFENLSNFFNTKYLTKSLDYYKIYRIGRFPKASTDWRTLDPRKEGMIWYGYWKTFWSYQHPRNWNGLTSQEIIDDILCFD